VTGIDFHLCLGTDPNACIWVFLCFGDAMINVACAAFFVAAQRASLILKLRDFWGQRNNAQLVNQQSGIQKIKKSINVLEKCCFGANWLYL
jgi:hypothetical protein